MCSNTFGECYLGIILGMMFCDHFESKPNDTIIASCVCVNISNKAETYSSSMQEFIQLTGELLLHALLLLNSLAARHQQNCVIP